MELTHKQKEAIKDFFFFTSPQEATSELNEMYRSHLRNSELFCDKKSNVMMKLADNHFMIEQICRLLTDLYDVDTLKDS